MNILYLHGFQSSALSIKGQQLKDYCTLYTSYTVHLPDLNMPPLQVIETISDLIRQLDDVVLVGSSLGGFYATQLVAKHSVHLIQFPNQIRYCFYDLQWRHI